MRSIPIWDRIQSDEEDLSVHLVMKNVITMLSLHDIEMIEFRFKNRWSILIVIRPVQDMTLKVKQITKTYTNEISNTVV